MFWNRKRLRGLTIGICFESRGKELNFDNYLIDSILNSGGLAVTIDVKHRAELGGGVYGKVLGLVPQANLLLFGHILIGKDGDSQRYYYQICFKGISRNGTIVGGGQIFVGYFVSKLPKVAGEVIKRLHVENLGKISQGGFEERIYTDIPSAIES